MSVLGVHVGTGRLERPQQVELVQQDGVLDLITKKPSQESVASSMVQTGLTGDRRDEEAVRVSSHRLPARHLRRGRGGFATYAARNGDEY
jgi:hypothetical protein